MLISHCHFDGPPKVHVPGGHCTPLTPLSVALTLLIGHYSLELIVSDLRELTAFSSGVS